MMGDGDIDLSGLTDDQIQQMIALGGIPTQQGIMQKQYDQAHAIRYGASPQGRDGGRVYTAPSPLETIGDTLQKAQAGRQMQDLKNQQQSSIQQQAMGRKAFLELLRRKQPSAMGQVGGDGTTYFGGPDG